MAIKVRSMHGPESENKTLIGTHKQTSYRTELTTTIWMYMESNIAPSLFEIAVFIGNLHLVHSNEQIRDV